MRKGKFGAALGAALLLATSGAVVAHGGDGPMRPGMHHHGGGGPGHMRGGDMGGEARAMHGGSMRGHGSGGPMGMRGPMGHGAMMMMGGMKTYIAGVLGLSEEQEARIEQIQQDAARSHWDLMQRMHERRRAMMEVRRQADATPEAVGEAYTDVSEVRREMIELRTRVRRDIRGVLDEQQRQRFDQMRRMHGRHH